MRRKILPCFAVTTFFASALDTSTDLFADFLDEKRSAAGRAGLVDWAIPQSILARRILTAGKERTAFSRALLDEVTATTWLGALHTQRERLSGLAFRVGRAGNELSKSPGLYHHRTTALLALLIRRQLNLRNNFNGAILKLLEILRVLAGRFILVCWASQKLTVAPPFNLHHSVRTPAPLREATPSPPPPTIPRPSTTIPPASRSSTRRRSPSAQDRGNP